MPVTFRDLGVLRRFFDGPTGVVYRAGEAEADYRERCAVWCDDRRDFIQAHEIRTGKGWNEWTPAEQARLIVKRVPWFPAR
jgi:hypothetical protein